MDISRKDRHMRNFVTCVIYSLIATFLSGAIIFLLQAPLTTLVYYGLFANDNPLVFIQNIINKTPNVDSITIVIMAIQIVLSLAFAFVLFAFFKKIIRIFLKDEKLIRPYYTTFFFMTLIVPIVFVFVSVLFRIRLFILIFVITGVFIVLNIVLTIFSKKIFPETTDYENRKYLFDESSENV